MVAQAARGRRAAHDPRATPRTRSARTRRGSRTRWPDARATTRATRRHAHGQRAARGPGRRRAVGADRRPARLGDQRAGRVRQDPGAGRGRPGLGRGRARPGDRHHPVPVRPQHPGRRGPGVLQRRPVPGPPARPARRPRPRPHRPGHPAGDRRGLDDVRPGPGRPDRLRRGHAAPRSSWPGTPASCRRWRTAAACPCSPTRLGYARLAEPVRFRAAWEQAASLRLRDGDTTRAGRVRPARPDHRRRPGADDGRRRGRLRRPDRWTAPTRC